MATIAASSITVTPDTHRIPLIIAPRPATPHRVTVQTLCSPAFRRTVSYRQAMRTVVEYIHSHRLQIVRRRTHFALDPLLCRLLQLSPSTVSEQYSYQELGRFLRSEQGVAPAPER